MDVISEGQLGKLVWTEEATGAPSVDGVLWTYLQLRNLLEVLLRVTRLLLSKCLVFSTW